MGSKDRNWFLWYLPLALWRGLILFSPGYLFPDEYHQGPEPLAVVLTGKGTTLTWETNLLDGLLYRSYAVISLFLSGQLFGQGLKLVEGGLPLLLAERATYFTLCIVLGKCNTCYNVYVFD